MRKKKLDKILKDVQSEAFEESRRFSDYLKTLDVDQVRELASFLYCELRLAQMQCRFEVDRSRQLAFDLGDFLIWGR